MASGEKGILPDIENIMFFLGFKANVDSKRNEKTCSITRTYGFKKLSSSCRDIWHKHSQIYGKVYTKLCMYSVQWLDVFPTPARKKRNFGSTKKTSSSPPNHKLQFSGSKTNMHWMRRKKIRKKSLHGSMQTKKKWKSSLELKSRSTSSRCLQSHHFSRIWWRSVRYGLGCDWMQLRWSLSALRSWSHSIN